MIPRVSLSNSKKWYFNNFIWFDVESCGWLQKRYIVV